MLFYSQKCRVTHSTPNYTVYLSTAIINYLKEMRLIKDINGLSELEFFCDFTINYWGISKQPLTSKSLNTVAFPIGAIGGPIRCKGNIACCVVS